MAGDGFILTSDDHVSALQTSIQHHDALVVSDVMALGERLTFEAVASNKKGCSFLKRMWRRIGSMSLLEQYIHYSNYAFRIESLKSTLEIPRTVDSTCQAQGL